MSPDATAIPIVRMAALTAWSESALRTSYELCGYAVDEALELAMATKPSSTTFVLLRSASDVLDTESPESPLGELVARALYFSAWAVWRAGIGGPS